MYGGGIRVRGFSVDSTCLKFCFILSCFDAPDPATCISRHEQTRGKSGMLLFHTADGVVSGLFTAYAMGLLCEFCGTT